MPQHRALWLTPPKRGLLLTTFCLLSYANLEGKNRPPDGRPAARSRPVCCRLITLVYAWNWKENHERNKMIVGTEFKLCESRGFGDQKSGPPGSHGTERRGSSKIAWVDEFLPLTRSDRDVQANEVETDGTRSPIATDWTWVVNDVSFIDLYFWSLARKHVAMGKSFSSPSIIFRKI